MKVYLQYISSEVLGVGCLELVKAGTVRSIQKYNCTKGNVNMN